MSKIYLPYAEQFDLMNENLSKIANALASDIDLSTWAGIQKAVRVGVAPDLIPVGTQLAVDHSVYGTHLYDVVAHNYFKSAHDKNAHTMTLMCHDVLVKPQYDAPEAFYYAEEELPSGTYNFTIPTSLTKWIAGTYQFTIASSLPKGGQLCISGNADSEITSRQVTTYANRTTTAATGSAAITPGSNGTSLGTFGTELNHTQRVSYGSNNYKESAIRQFLNSSAGVGSVWVPQTKFDRPPSWVASLAGFVDGLEDDFLSVIGEVVIPCATNNIYESPDSTTVKGEKYIVTDRFYLASQKELFGTSTDTSEDDSVLFPYYEGAVDADYIKYSGDAASWWARSSHSNYATNVRAVTLEGKSSSYNAYRTHGCAPAFSIV